MLIGTRSQEVDQRTDAVPSKVPVGRTATQIPDEQWDLRVGAGVLGPFDHVVCGRRPRLEGAFRLLEPALHDLAQTVPDGFGIVEHQIPRYYSTGTPVALQPDEGTCVLRSCGTTPAPRPCEALRANVRAAPRHGSVRYDGLLISSCQA